MDIQVPIWYPTEGFGETLSVEVEEGETVVEAIQLRGQAQFEFVLVTPTEGEALAGIKAATRSGDEINKELSRLAGEIEDIAQTGGHANGAYVRRDAILWVLGQA